MAGESYSDWLKARIEETGISLDELRQRTKLSVSTLRNLRDGWQRPLHKTAQDIARAIHDYEVEVHQRKAPNDLYLEARKESLVDGHYRKAETLARAAADKTSALEDKAKYLLYCALMRDQYGDINGAWSDIATVEQLYRRGQVEVPGIVTLQLRTLRGWVSDSAGDSKRAFQEFRRALRISKSLKSSDHLMVAEMTQTAIHFLPRQVSALMRRTPEAWFICPTDVRLVREDQTTLEWSLNELENLQGKGPIESRARNQGLAYQLQKLKSTKSAARLEEGMFQEAGITHVFDEYVVWYDLGQGSTDHRIADLRDDALKMKRAQHRYAQLDHPRGLANSAGLEAVARGLAKEKNPVLFLDLWSVVLALTATSTPYHPMAIAAGSNLLTLANQSAETEIIDYLKNLPYRIREGDGPWYNVALLSGDFSSSIVTNLSALFTRSQAARELLNPLAPSPAAQEILFPDATETFPDTTAYFSVE